MSTRLKVLLQIPVIAAFALVLSGCGEPTGIVGGRVTYKGDPVTNGAIAFHMPSKGIAQNGKIDGSGKYTMTTPLPAGTYQVYYVPPAVEPQDPSKKSPPPEVKTIVPKRFHDLQGAMSVDVKSGKNEIPIDFKD